MSIRTKVQSALAAFGYRLIRLPTTASSGFDIMDRKTTIRGEDRSRGPARGDLERWFRAGEPVDVFKWQHYFDVYERHFAPLRGRPGLKILEIGVFKGGSLRMWKSYFGADATVVGVDIDSGCQQHERAAEKIHVRIGDQASASFLASLHAEFGPFDVVIDDGGHTTTQQIESFLHLYFSAMTEEGIYLVEDLHTNYWPDFMNHPRGLTFVDLALELAHKLHDVYVGRRAEFERFSVTSPDRFDAIEVSAFCAQTRSIHIHDSIIVFERGRKTIPYTEMR
jgi:hypothetical protein